MSFRAVVAASLAVAVLLAAPAAASAALPPESVSRIQGDDRYATAVEISQQVAPGGAFAVFVASGEAYPDALAAGPAAAVFGARTPLLLVPHDGVLPAVVADELRRLHPTSIYVAGGTGAVSERMLGQLAAYSQQFFRFAGTTRYDTAAQLARFAAPDRGRLFVATGEGFADALAVGAIAARGDAGLLLTRPDTLPAEAEAVLSSTHPVAVTVVGGSDVVSEAVLQRISEVSGAPVRRVSGDDRYGTAAALVGDSYYGGHAAVFAATGADYPDALAGGLLAAGTGTGAPLLLLAPTCARAPIVEQATRLGVRFVTALGGSDVVPDAAAQLTPCP